MHLSAIGKVVESYLKEIPAVFPHMVIDEWVIMPDHVHMILIIEEERKSSSKNTPWRVPTDPKEGVLRGLQPLVKGSISSAINHFKGNVKK